MVEFQYTSDFGKIFRFQQKIGEGVYGSVQKATLRKPSKRITDTEIWRGNQDSSKKHSDDTVYACKIVERTDVFLREVDHLVECKDCVGVLPLQAVYIDDRNMLMQFPLGKSFDQVILERKFVNLRNHLDWVLRICIHLLRATHDIHKRGIVHRDIKPANIVLWNKYHQMETDHNRSTTTIRREDQSKRVAASSKDDAMNRFKFYVSLGNPYLIDFGFSKRISEGYELADDEYVRKNNSNSDGENSDNRTTLMGNGSRSMTVPGKYRIVTSAYRAPELFHLVPCQEDRLSSDSEEDIDDDETYYYNDHTEEKKKTYTNDISLPSIEDDNPKIRYGPLIDEWSIGCVLVECFQGTCPFECPEEKDVKEKLYQFVQTRKNQLANNNPLSSPYQRESKYQQQQKRDKSGTSTSERVSNSQKHPCNFDLMRDLRKLYRGLDDYDSRAFEKRIRLLEIARTKSLEQCETETAKGSMNPENETYRLTTLLESERIKRAKDKEGNRAMFSVLIKLVQLLLEPLPEMRTSSGRILAVLDCGTPTHISPISNDRYYHDQTNIQPGPHSNTGNKKDRSNESGTGKFRYEWMRTTVTSSVMAFFDALKTVKDCTSAKILHHTLELWKNYLLNAYDPSTQVMQLVWDTKCSLIACMKVSLAYHGTPDDDELVHHIQTVMRLKPKEIEPFVIQILTHRRGRIWIPEDTSTLPEYNLTQWDITRESAYIRFFCRNLFQSFSTKT